MRLIFNNMYHSPAIEEMLSETANMLCESPGSGSNEDLTYDEWTI